ncbi:uncharacterized protein L3040_004150 [Drepanopeziza brunnea f. sp. 'multigermtubi']|uniref:Putative ureidoglycolate hydrolase n=1 Tax=Marssonina brunnea f. sp. multigermtubi (strain MB_m1) TaxID=1072389 RepID=K1Y5T7_MARBU|nr:putative ureidoglycolate hydrolase [Drepanopeziza brunnea f. sp. 'multigermtubi' MB_m1]EKD20559.1 putative ureidoglycolate hydrolase [Drepanopeziza brunnea f. sp. 'multigermtubi' MB_m1]KAJ5042753.1 hypothetical protein L3040_004150 [Drepanopeziza brunnea f. sp. 'multigermtubi']
MPVSIPGPARELVLTPEALNQAAFAEFGTVIENPAPSLVPSSRISSLPPNAVQANQGSALKYLDVTHMEDYYPLAPSKVASKAVMNMFVCAPRRPLLPSHGHAHGHGHGHADTRSPEGHFPIEILERHPYTTQTFIPLGLSAAETHRVRYLVIVAPSLPATAADQHLPVPSSPAAAAAPAARDELPGRGLPDLRRVKAFFATGAQAVTYGAGTWHAPMVVVGGRPIDFVVVQFANGVGIEDCQEAELAAENGPQLLVAVRVQPQTPLKL